MNPEWKKKWVEALRSGQYKQCNARLKKMTSSSPAYCCLGVLQELVNPNSFELEIVKDTRSSQGAFLDVETSRITCLFASPQGALSVMNDSGRTFSEIADYIEREL